jgi:hypothetical protein
MSSPNFKSSISKTRRGGSSPATQINKALFTLNFLNCFESAFTPAEKHWEHCNKQHLPQVLWKDVMTGAWHGLSPVLLWGQSHVCIFPGGVEIPIWVPSVFVKMHGTHQPSDAEAPPDEGGEEPKPTKTKPVEILSLKGQGTTLMGPKKGNIITLTNTVKQPRDLFPQLGIKYIAWWICPRMPLRGGDRKKLLLFC